jgi:diadenosine tetraphosphate (Ap4A) HIT family hydrolase
MNNCPFCNLPQIRIIESNDLGIAIRDAYPISPGHTLIIPKRHIGSFFDTTDLEKKMLLVLLASTKRQIQEEFNTEAFNIGINDGTLAGQTVPHLHIHLIPRYKNDSADPRGGVRWVIPNKAKYWK